MEIEALLGRHRSGPPWEYRWLQYHLVHQIIQLDSDALRLEGHDGSPHVSLQPSVPHPLHH